MAWPARAKEVTLASATAGAVTVAAFGSTARIQTVGVARLTCAAQLARGSRTTETIAVSTLAGAGFVFSATLDLARRCIAPKITGFAHGTNALISVAVAIALIASGRTKSHHCSEQEPEEKISHGLGTLPEVVCEPEGESFPKHGVATLVSDVETRATRG